MRRTRDPLRTSPETPLRAGADTEEDRRLLVLTAGIGITSALAMAHALVAARSARPVDFVHVVRDIESLPHWDELQRAAAQLGRARLHLYVTRPRQEDAAVEHNPGRPDGTLIAGILTDPASTEVHMCGSTSFVTDMRAAAQAAGVPASSIRYDAFYSRGPWTSPRGRHRTRDRSR
ncbi:ferredoxin reductase domain-containing protein [Streptomyces europaeiscabiei]|uniref:hypothetical protein n=1 Tax=Streptomyces europaeiscabiei TaxID=146819 RepID=UPI0038F65F1A